MEIYTAKEVADVASLHPYLRDKSFRALPIRDQIEKQASVLHAAHTTGDRRVAMHLACWWPKVLGLPLDSIMAEELSLEDAQLTMAREYGFENWAEVSALERKTLNLDFEAALDDLLSGEIEKLRMHLDNAPQLVSEKSDYGHQATLLHYIAANGVESHRQRTPMNAADLAALLIDYGADKNAKANMYGGGQTPFALSTTSAHPHNAGISEDLNRVLNPLQS